MVRLWFFIPLLLPSVVKAYTVVLRPAQRLTRGSMAARRMEVSFSEVQTTRGGSDYVTRAVKRLVDSIEKVDVEILKNTRLRRTESWTIWGALGLAVFFAICPNHGVAHMSHYALPVCTATIATVGAVSEFLGGSNAARAHEISAQAVRAAAEAEEILSQAERTKAVLPVCVVFSAATAALSVLSSKAIELLFEDVEGLTLDTETPSAVIASSAATTRSALQTASFEKNNGAGDFVAQNHENLFFSDGGASDVATQWMSQQEVNLLHPVDFNPMSDVLDAEAVTNGLPEQVRTAYLLVCPVASILAATVASLAQIEVSNKCAKAQALGRRRFATRRDVGRTWQSATELVDSGAERERQNLQGFGTSLIPGPLAASLVSASSGTAFKAVVGSAAAAAQAALYLTIAEYSLARATESVSAKSRTAAVAEAWNAQAQLANGRVPAASAVAILCMALTCLSVEVLPRALCLVFPFCAAFFVTLASKFRALTRGSVDAVAAAADQLAGLDDGSDDDPLLPIVLTWRNLGSALSATQKELELRRRATVRFLLRGGPVNKKATTVTAGSALLQPATQHRDRND